MKSRFGGFLLVIAMVAVIAGMGWLERRTSTPGGSCGIGATCPSAPEVLKKTAGSTEAQEGVAVRDPKSSAKVRPKLIDLGSTTCVPCKMMTPILDDLSKSYKGKLDVEFIDVTKNQAAATMYGIRSIPTQIFFDDQGKEFYRHLGFYPKEDILKVFEDNGIKLGSGSNK